MDVQCTASHRARNKVRIGLLSWLILPGAVLLLSACATDPKSTKVTKFNEADAADIVVRYASDQTIYRLKPDAHEGAFYHIFTRQELCDEDARRIGPRNLAVVLIGHYWTPELEAQARQNWIENLTRLNYRRVVILRASDSDRVNGLSVLDDRLVGQVATAAGLAPPMRGTLQ